MNLRLIIALLLLPSLSLAGQGMGPGPGFRTYSAAPSGYSDTFTGANDTLLATHNSSWASASGTFLVSNFEIIDNAVTTLSAWVLGGAYHTESTSDISQITIKALTNTAQAVNKYAAVRMNGTSLGYNVYLAGLSAGNWTGVTARKDTTQLGVSCSGLTISAGSDHVLMVKAVGTSTVTITAYVDGTQVCQWTDSSSTITSGHPGFLVTGNGTVGNNALDNWYDYEN